LILITILDLYINAWCSAEVILDSLQVLDFVKEAEPQSRIRISTNATAGNAVIFEKNDKGEWIVMSPNFT